jgi:3-oxoacyl-[acyl-carrier protein] reductase
MKLEGKIALVTGGGSGIGRAIAQRFAEEGARVVVNDIRKDAAERAAAEIGGARAHAIAADVADSTAVRAMFEEIERAFGGLDILVNNAGIAEVDSSGREAFGAKVEARVGEMMMGGTVQTHWDITQSLSDGEWSRMLAVHLNGTFYCTREALRLMSRVNRGAIVNISSVAGLMGIEVAPHYGAAKAGILGFTRSVAREVASRGIRVNAICPGFIDTPILDPLPPVTRIIAERQTPLGRLGEPREIAAAALFLASDEASFITGVALPVDGGQSARIG